MAIPVKLDEALSDVLITPLAARGYTVHTVRGQGWGGLKDAVIWPRVVAEGVYFITADKGFGDLRSFAPGTHPGILILRPDRPSIPAYQDLLERVLNKHPLHTLAGCIAVASPRSIRVRRAP